MKTYSSMEQISRSCTCSIVVLFSDAVELACSPCSTEVLFSDEVGLACTSCGCVSMTVHNNSNYY